MKLVLKATHFGDFCSVCKKEMIKDQVFIQEAIESHGGYHLKRTCSDCLSEVEKRLAARVKAEASSRNVNSDGNQLSMEMEA